MILKLENICYRYNANGPEVLSDINYGFEKGKMYAITGESGSGKTTLLSIIARLDKPVKGKIYYDGSDTANLNPDEYRTNKVSVIFQGYNLLYNYTAADNVMTILNLSKYSGDYAQRADELLQEVSIPKEKRNSLVQHLSGGEQQRVAIARALASNAEIILADEPTGNLDGVNSENIIALFKDLIQKYQKCVIIVTHSPNIAAYADHIIKIESGTIA